nr:hypothetical protein [Roseimaritima sediminicola]
MSDGNDDDAIRVFAIDDLKRKLHYAAALMNVVNPDKPVWILADFFDRQVNGHGEASRRRRASLSIPVG